MKHLSKQLDAFDILYKNFFNADTFFAPVMDAKIGHPVDIYENKNGLHFEIACTGLSKEDVEINIDRDILRVFYNKPQDDSCCEVNECKYLHKGIAKRSFNLGYRVSSRFNIVKAEAKMADGLLKITIPFAEETELVTSISIK